MNVKSVINEIAIMAILIIVILVAAYMLFYNQMPKTVDKPEHSTYKATDEIQAALEEIEEGVEDTSILNAYTGEKIYTRKYEHGKVNPFDRSKNTLYIAENVVTGTQGNTTQGASGGSTGSNTSSNTTSGGKLTNTTGK